LTTSSEGGLRVREVVLGQPEGKGWRPWLLRGERKKDEG